MHGEKIFIGRSRELKEFEEFLIGNRQNYKGKGRGNPVLLVVGDEGMGKTALLQAMAVKGISKNHYIAVGEVDDRQSEFSEQIYPLIATLKRKKRLELGKGAHWLKAGLTGLGALGGLFSVAAGFANLLIEIRKEHKGSGAAPLTLAQIFHSELVKLDTEIEDSQRIVLFLDPEKLSPPALIPLLRTMWKMGFPSKTRFVVAQRPEDYLISAVKQRELEELCTEPLYLKRMSKDEDLEFFRAYGDSQKLDLSAQDIFLERYGGWPLFLLLALEELQEIESDVTREIIEKLPGNIEDFWYERYQKIQKKESRIFVQTVCMLPHPYPINRLAKFSDLSPSEIDVAWNDHGIWKILERQDYYEPFSGTVWEACASPRHATAQDHVLSGLLEYEDLYQERISAIISNYRAIIGTDIEGGKVDRDALVYLPYFLFLGGFWENFLTELHRLGPVKMRYGLLVSQEYDLWAALDLIEELIQEELNKEDAREIDDLKARIFGHLGLIYDGWSEFDSAREMYQEALEIHKKSDDKEGLAGQHCNLGSTYAKQGYFEKADALFKESLKIAESIDHKKLIATLSTNLGNNHSKRGELEEAEEMYRKALVIYEKNDDMQGMAISYSGLGTIWMHRKNLSKSKDFFLKAFKINKMRGDLPGMAKLCSNLGDIYQEMNDLEKAERMYTKTLDISEKIENMEGVAIARINLGSIYQEKGDLKNAEIFYLKALEIDKQINRKIGTVIEYTHLGEIYREQKQFDRAENMYKKAIEDSKEINHRPILSASYSDLADLYWQRKALQKAEEMYMEALAVDKQIDNLEGLVERYSKLAQVYAELGLSEKYFVTIRLGIEAKVKAEPDFAETAKVMLQSIDIFAKAKNSPEKLSEAINLMGLVANKVEKDKKGA